MYPAVGWAVDLIRARTKTCYMGFACSCSFTLSLCVFVSVLVLVWYDVITIVEPPYTWTHSLTYMNRSTCSFVFRISVLILNYLLYQRAHTHLMHYKVYPLKFSYSMCGYARAHLVLIYQTKRHNTLGYRMCIWLTECVYDIFLSVQFSAKWGYSGEQYVFGVKSQWVGGEQEKERVSERASACLLANILVVKRCNQILCSMCGTLHNWKTRP